MSRAFIAGAYEHPGRDLPDVTLTQIHEQVALGALDDAGLSLSDVDGLITSPDAPGLGLLSMADHLGLRDLKYLDTTESGGSAYVMHAEHAAAAISRGACSVVLVTMAGKSRRSMPRPAVGLLDAPELSFESVFGNSTVAEYALAARRHMFEFGTTSRQLAEVKVTASLHAQHNPNAVMPTVVTVDEVLDSPMISDPLHRLDCCVNTDGGGALVVVSEEVARSLSRPLVTVRAASSTVRAAFGGRIRLTSTGADVTGPRAFESAGLRPADIDYLGVYDSFTITVVQQLEDLGFCAPGEGGPFVASGSLRSPDGALPTNTDGGGLCSNHPGTRGGMPKIIEAVRQLRGEATTAVQVPNCALALVNGTGGSIGSRHGSATLIMERI